MALYRSGELIPFAATDAPEQPANCVSFHPTESVVAIGAGSYDGGFLFEGDLVFWNWKTGDTWRLVSAIPEVTWCEFSADGRTLRALVRPWDEEWGRQPDEPADVAFKSFYAVQIPYAPMPPANPSHLNVDSKSRRLGAELDDLVVPGSASASATAQLLREWAAVPDVTSGTGIWDVRWLDGGRLAAVHDGCLFEVYDLATGAVERFEGDGFGADIVRTSPPLVHVAKGTYRDSPQSSLLVVEPSGLRKVLTVDGRFSFTAARDGRALGRLDRNCRGNCDSDLIFEPSSGTVRWIDVGHYDCFNHYIGIDGGVDLFALRGSPPSSHEHKCLCTIAPSGKIQVLWPVLQDDGTNASHAMECCGCFVEDGLGTGVILSGVHYAPNPYEMSRGFIYRRGLEADSETWRRPTDAAASAILHSPEQSSVFAAFLDGSLVVLDARSGNQVGGGKVYLDGLPTVIFSMDIQREALALGTFDGRIVVLSSRELLSRGAPVDRLELN